MESWAVLSVGRLGETYVESWAAYLPHPPPPRCLSQSPPDLLLQNAGSSFPQHVLTFVSIRCRLKYDIQGDPKYLIPFQRLVIVTYIARFEISTYLLKLEISKFYCTLSLSQLKTKFTWDHHGIGEKIYSNDSGQL